MAHSFVGGTTVPSCRIRPDHATRERVAFLTGSGPTATGLAAVHLRRTAHDLGTVRLLLGRTVLRDAAVVGLLLVQGLAHLRLEVVVGVVISHAPTLSPTWWHVETVCGATRSRYRHSGD